MKYSKLEEHLFEIREKIAELEQQKQALKLTYSLPKSVMCDGYVFQARWKVTEDGLTYSIQVFRGKAQVIECVQGELYKDASVPSDVFRRAQEIQELLVNWLADKIEWPFSQEDYPRV